MGSSLDGFSNVISTENELAAGILPGNLVGDIDPASQFVGKTEDALVITGSSIDIDMIWLSFNVPLRITENNSVNSAFTISAGNTLLFESGTGFNIGSSGSLNAVGTAGEPIVFTGTQASPGFWRGIQFTFSNNINNVLDNVVVEYAGDSPNGSGSIVLFGSSVSNA